MLARRVSALLQRWGIEADDSAGRPLSETPVGTLLLGIAAAAAEDLAPVPLLALLKHPLVGGGGEDRLRWLDTVRRLDLALRGPRPGAGVDGLDAHIREREQEPKYRGCAAAWAKLRPSVAVIAGMFTDPLSLAEFVRRIVDAAGRLAGDQPWRGNDGRMAADLLAELEAAPGASTMPIGAEDAIPVLRDLLEQQRVRPAYGGHPRIFIWGLLEARLQQADLMG